MLIQYLNRKSEQPAQLLVNQLKADKPACDNTLGVLTNYCFSIIYNLVNTS
jgi:hypothetical protein